MVSGCLVVLERCVLDVVDVGVRAPDGMKAVAAQISGVWE